MPKLRRESSVKWRSRSGSASSGRRGGSARRSSAGSSGGAPTSGPQPREVDEARQREQRLVGGDVRGRLLAPDVLLAGLEGEDIAAVPRGVSGLADDAPRHAADVVRPRGEEAVVRPAEREGVPRRLP